MEQIPDIIYLFSRGGVLPTGRFFSGLSQTVQGTEIIQGELGYDGDMSDIFFAEPGIRYPDHHLACGGDRHVEEIGKKLHTPRAHVQHLAELP